MRKIEKEMLAAVCERMNWSNGNTSVHVSNDKKVVRVLLHGNLIYVCKGMRESFSLAGWDTTTTCSRLRALGVKIFHKNRKPYVSKCSNLANAIEIDKNEWYNF